MKKKFNCKFTPLFLKDMQGTKNWSPWMQLAILLILCGVGLIIGSLASAGIAFLFFHIPFNQLSEGLLNPKNVALLQVLQTVSSFFVMALPALAFARMMNKKDALSELGFNRAISGKQFFIVVLMAISGLFIGGALAELNSMIPISKTAEQFFQQLEDQYNEQVLALANMKTNSDFLLSLLVLALAPAIMEEMLFRGTLQPVFISISKNAFIGILVTSILFSAIHFSFYGFLTRLFLGLLLGYVYYLSKNLWLNVSIHFLNNAVAVAQLYALSKAGMLNNDTINEHIPLYYGLIGVVTLAMLFFNFKRESELVIARHNIINHKYLK
ncbi:MAG: CPBP family intramembrane glutamic endopeptidase [Chitinophagaceae bacterium]